MVSGGQGKYESTDVDKIGFLSTGFFLLAQRSDQMKS